MTELALTWWGASAVELAVGSRRLAIDPVGRPAEPVFRCVCVTREDHDHFDPSTLRKLVQASVFERLIVAPGCAMAGDLSAPLADGAVDAGDLVPANRLTVIQPTYRRDPSAVPSGGPVQVAGFHIEAVDSSYREPVSIIERWPRRRTERRPVWPSGDGALIAPDEVPPVGYVVTDESTGTVVYHPGDLQEVFDAHRQLRGHIDCLLLPLPAAVGIEVSLVDAVRPRRVVPIHYRRGEHSIVPASSAVDLTTGYPLPGAAPESYGLEIERLAALGWFPSPNPPLKRIRALRGAIEALDSELVILEEGRPLRLRSAAAHR